MRKKTDEKRSEKEVGRKNAPWDIKMMFYPDELDFFEEVRLAFEGGYSHKFNLQLRILLEIEGELVQICDERRYPNGIIGKIPLICEKAA